ncbi:hypothetical protein FQN50_008913 [Emmonsiellopsis sp. PD_5]|nr:hypothetical protein FQN50_008913 [Emmonsiellopsis sp. PD_5]
MWVAPQSTVRILAWSLCFNYVAAGDILKNNGFTTCLDSSDIKVDKVDLSFDRASKTINFDVAGSSKKSQNVTASLVITAYGQEFTQEFNPCDKDTKVDQLCPVPVGNFGAKGEQKVPSDFADRIPSIAFAIPDLEAQATLELKSNDGDKTLACISSKVGNGKTLEAPAVSYVAAGIAGAALAMSGAAALAASGQPGAATSSPTFGEVFGWFQSMAVNGMLSVNYPPIYRSFTKNFAFSGGLIPWNQMQTKIDNFRNVTGGNLTHNNFAYLQNATLIFQDGTSSNTSKRSLDFISHAVHLVARQISTSVNETSGNSTAENDAGVNHVVKGIQGYVEMLSIPQANTFMTVLLIFAVAIAAIAAGILLCKVILEVWSLFGSFPAKLTNFRKDYWGLMARTITSLILVLYGVWTLYCVFQFTRGDSWAAKVLAGISLALFTAVLAFFTFKIWRIARKYKKAEGNTSGLYEDHETWRKYSLFYDNYKKGYWWIFVPIIVYMFVRGCIIAGGDGHGLFQSAGQLAVEAIMLILLLWSRPYEAKSGQWINITIQVVRVLSVGCILVFVEELGISQTTQTVTGVALIAVQSTLTGILAILIVVNAVILFFRKKPQVKPRKDPEDLDRDLDNLTPLDARNSLLEQSKPHKRYKSSETGIYNYQHPYEPYQDFPFEKSRHTPTASTDRLIALNSTPYTHEPQRSVDSTLYPERQPRLPQLDRPY